MSHIVRPRRRGYMSHGDSSIGAFPTSRWASWIVAWVCSAVQSLASVMYDLNLQTSHLRAGGGGREKETTVPVSLCVYPQGLGVPWAAAGRARAYAHGRPTASPLRLPQISARTIAARMSAGRALPSALHRWFSYTTPLCLVSAPDSAAAETRTRGWGSGRRGRRQRSAGTSR